MASLPDHPEELLALGEMHYSANPRRDQDVQIAVRYFAAAAAQRHPRAALILGVIYFKGEGVSRDVRQASRHFSLAAEAADSLGGDASVSIKAFAYANWAFCLEFDGAVGAVAPGNLKEAIRLYQLAADLGHPRALSALLRLRDKKSEPLPPDLFENFTQMGPLLYKRRFVLCILHAKTLYSCTDKDDEPADDSPLLPAVGAGIESSMRGLVGATLVVDPNLNIVRNMAVFVLLQAAQVALKSHVIEVHVVKKNQLDNVFALGCQDIESARVWYQCMIKAQGKKMEALLLSMY